MKRTQFEKIQRKQALEELRRHLKMIKIMKEAELKGEKICVR